jgi:ferredoxin
MNGKASDVCGAAVTIDRADLDDLFDILRESGYELIGPSVHDGAIVYDRIEASDDLPVGWTDDQDAASYRLARRDDQACFGFVVGPHSWKRYLFPPEVRLWSATRSQDGFAFKSDRDAPRLALIGVRACELAAIGIQDAVFTGREHRDADYASRRDNIFLVAVNCTEAGGTCFCVSMGTGPTARSGYDLALTEVVEDGQHYFVLRGGSETGTAILERLGRARPAAEAELAFATRAEQRASAQMGRRMETDGLPKLLRQVARHPHWDDVAERCLSCANCTLVCPTCFCHNVEDVVDLTGENAERWRHWDSCFNGDYSYIHGGKIRPSIRGRYRQWLTHKLGTWHDQFGTSGCVGCGRCITWCPVGIDITAEVRALQSQSGAADEETSP